LARVAWSRARQREVALSELYNNDGIDYIRRRPDEILAEVLLDLHGWKSTTEAAPPWFVRPVLSVAALRAFPVKVWSRMRES
jgi:hypothetical protein